MYDYLLKLFVGNDFKYRPKMTLPVTINNSTYASDSYALIKIPANLTENYKCKQNEIKYEDVIDKKLFNSEDKIQITKNDLFDILAKARISYNLEKINCDSCNGTGEIICDCCGSSHECKNCKGTGVISNNSSMKIKYITIEKDDYTAHSISIEDKINLAPFNVDRILQTMLITNTEEITIFFTEHRIQIKINDIIILMMQIIN